MKPLEAEANRALEPKSPWRDWRGMIPIWVLIGGAVYVAYTYNFDARLVAAAIILFGLATNAFVWLLGIVALVPWIGGPIVKILSLPFVWLLNALGYIVSFVAIKSGYTQQVLNYRVVTIALLVGVVVGYVLGKLF